MTEEEWLMCGDPAPMLEFLRGNANDRKLRLFGVACCRRIWHLLEHEDSWRNAVEVAEQFADGLVTTKQRGTARSAIRAEMPSRVICGTVKAVVKSLASEAAKDSSHYAACAAGWSALSAARSQGVDEDRAQEEYDTAFRSEKDCHTTLLRDIFGNPFRRVSFDPAWRTSTAVALAEGMYANRDFGAMPILADALQDAGCDNEDVLNHCRDTTLTHVRGCWVVDLVLGKE